MNYGNFFKLSLNQERSPNNVFYVLSDIRDDLSLNGDSWKRKSLNSEESDTRSQISSDFSLRLSDDEDEDLNAPLVDSRLESSDGLPSPISSPTHVTGTAFETYTFVIY